MLPSDGPSVPNENRDSSSHTVREEESSEGASADDESRQMEAPDPEMLEEAIEKHSRALGSIIKQMFDKTNAEMQSANADIQELREELSQMRRNITWTEMVTKYLPML